MGLQLRHKLSGLAAAKAEQWRFCAPCSTCLEKRGPAGEVEAVMEKADDQNGGDPEQSATGSLSAAPKHALRDASSGG